MVAIVFLCGFLLAHFQDFGTESRRDGDEGVYKVYRLMEKSHNTWNIHIKMSSFSCPCPRPEGV